MSKPILKVTAADVKDGVYVGMTSACGFDGHLEIDADPGRVRFDRAVSVTGYVYARSGSRMERASRTVTCSRFVGGEVAYGILVETDAKVES